MMVFNLEDELTKSLMYDAKKKQKNNTDTGTSVSVACWWKRGDAIAGVNDAWIQPEWRVDGMQGMPFRASGRELGDVRGCWGRGVLPACEQGGDPGPRGWWRGGPLSSSPPPGPGSAVQTAPPAPWLTPAEPPRSHTAPYTLHGPRGKRVVGGIGVGAWGCYTHPCCLKNTRVGVQQKQLSSGILSSGFKDTTTFSLVPDENWSLHCCDT